MGPQMCDGLASMRGFAVHHRVASAGGGSVPRRWPSTREEILNRDNLSLRSPQRNIVHLQNDARRAVHQPSVVPSSPRSGGCPTVISATTDAAAAHGTRASLQRPSSDSGCSRTFPGDADHLSFFFLILFLINLISNKSYS
ncbi:hypothetical protein MANES_01G022150v8 [Manihot esculenta]|uniref:Uncharacterized protein n=1 Tax=Manihot esculenta TaxID=3983 RepID=A0ACB7IBJ3_MANES|nr:hypothetical protein MANES_01G022150v8 [Manihot esculenta]